MASEALLSIEQAKELLTPSDYEELYQLFKRTYLTAQLHEAVATAYYGSRVYARGIPYRYNGLKIQMLSALERIDTITDEMKSMEDTFPIGQWNWLKDAEMAFFYKEKTLTR